MRYLFIGIACLCFTNCDSVRPPVAVLQAFSGKYPSAEELSWNIDRNGRYEACYTLNGTNYRSDFELDGQWVETETSVKWKELPLATQAAFEEEANKKDIIELELVASHEKGTFYDIEYKIKGGKQDIMITPAGKILGTDSH